jgi:hypothetical protein
MRAPRKRRRSLAIAWIAAVAVCAAPAFADSGPDDDDGGGSSAQQLLDRTLRNLYEGDFVQVFALRSQRRAGRAMTRRLQVVRKESERPGRAVLRFLSPDDVRGSSMLVIERDDQPDDVFLYLPAAERTRRISLAQRYDSFFGTNLTYEDLEPKYARDWEAHFDGRSEVAGVRCLELRIRPREGVESQYDETRACIDPERALALRTEYWVDGRLVKTLSVDPARVDYVDGRFVARFARLESARTDFTTEITSELYERKASIPDRIFSTWNLQTGDDASDLRALRGADDVDADGRATDVGAGAGPDETD